MRVGISYDGNRYWWLHGVQGLGAVLMCSLMQASTDPPWLSY